MNILVYNEFTFNQHHECCLKYYPQGLHNTIKDFLEKADSSNRVTCYTLDTVNAITDEVLNNTDVVFWWGHCNHDDVPNDVARRVADHVNRGMGLCVLHSGHYSKPFKLLMGTSCSLSWREAEELERIWIVEPSHPIARGLGEYFELEHEEMYGERFDVPAPDELVMMGWFKGGDVFRSAIVYNRGYGKVFYFQPGHETHPTYFNANIQKIMNNAANYLKSGIRVAPIESPNRKMIEQM